MARERVVRSLMACSGEPEVEEKRQQLIDQLWKKYGVANHREARSRNLDGDLEAIIVARTAGLKVLREKWVLENAAKRGVSISELLRMAFETRLELVPR